MKKIFSVLTLLALFLFGCSKDDKNANSSDVPTIKIISIGGGQPDNYDTWVKKVNEYIEPKIGANIELEIISWGDWDTRRSVITTSGEPFDILFSNLNNYGTDVRTGVALDISNLIDKPKFSELKNLIPQGFWDGVRIDGKIYSVPTYKDSSVTQYFVIDKSLIDEFKLDTSKIKELGDLTDFLTKVKAKTGKASFYLTKDGSNQIFKNYDSFGLEGVLGVRFDDNEYKVVNMFEEPEIARDLNILHKWYKSGIINTDAATTTERPKYVPVFIAQGWPLAGKTVWGPSIGAEVETIKYGETIISNGTVQGSLNIISANSKYPEKALAFLQLINTDTQLRDMFAYGEAGVNFDYVEAFGEKRVDRDPGKYVEWKIPAYTQAQFFNMTLSKEVQENQWDQVKQLNEEAIPSVLLGFSFDTSNIHDEIANVFAVYNKYKAELLTGTKDPNQLVPKIIEEMKKVGLDDIQKEAQKQIDTFKKTK